MASRASYIAVVMKRAPCRGFGEVRNPTPLSITQPLMLNIPSLASIQAALHPHPPRHPVFTRFPNCLCLTLRCPQDFGRIPPALRTLVWGASTNCSSSHTDMHTLPTGYISIAHCQMPKRGLGEKGDPIPPDHRPQLTGLMVLTSFRGLLNCMRLSRRLFRGPSTSTFCSL